MAREGKRGLILIPEFPGNSFWGYQSIMRYMDEKKKTTFSPLGAITFAAYMPPPPEWELELIDLNVESMEDGDLHERMGNADAIFFSAMAFQKRALVRVLRGPARGIRAPRVLGGAYASSYWEQMVNPQTASDQVLHDELDVLVWGAAQHRVPELLQTLEERCEHSECTPTVLIPPTVANAGESYKYINSRDIFKPFENIRVPRWELVDVEAYQTLTMQTSEGCRFRCNFCDIIKMAGGFTRTKSSEQITAELEAIHQAVQRASRTRRTTPRQTVFLAEDNGVSAIAEVPRVLRTITDYQRLHNYPFDLIQQDSVDLGLPQNQFLIPMFAEAGFGAIFFGIETPDHEALHAMNKKQNEQVDLQALARSMHRVGIQTLAGFIWGNDTDTRAHTKIITDFVEQAPIFSAMTGMLTPIPGTKLYFDLARERRLLPAEYTGNNVDDEVQFIPKNMTVEEMREGFHEILQRLFNSTAAYRRAGNVLGEIRHHIFSEKKFELWHAKAALRSIWEQGIRSRDPEYFRLLGSAIGMDREEYRTMEQEAQQLGGDWGFGGTYRHAEALDPQGQERFRTMIGYARAHLIRSRPDKSLPEVNEYIAGLERQAATGRVSPDDARLVYHYARDFLDTRRERFRFPGQNLCYAIVLAVKALHYENVMRETTQKSTGAANISFCRGEVPAAVEVPTAVNQ